MIDFADDAGEGNLHFLMNSKMSLNVLVCSKVILMSHVSSRVVDPRSLMCVKRLVTLNFFGISPNKFLEIRLFLCSLPSDSNVTGFEELDPDPDVYLCSA